MYLILEYTAYVSLVLVLCLMLFLATTAYLVAQEGVRKVGTAYKRMASRLLSQLPRALIRVELLASRLAPPYEAQPTSPIESDNSFHVNGSRAG